MDVYEDKDENGFQAKSAGSFRKKRTWRPVWRFLKKLQIELLYDPAIPLLGHTKETRIGRDTYTPMFITALFIMPGHGSNLDVHQQMNG